MTRLDELYELQRLLDAEIERELEALTRMATLRDSVRELLATTRTNVVQILAAAADAYGVTIDDIKARGPRGRQAVVDARHIAVWLLHAQGMPFAEIGRELGRDHTTAMHAVRRVNSTARLFNAAVSLRDGLPSRALDLSTPTLREVSGL